MLESSNFVYTMSIAKCTTEHKTKVLIFVTSFLFSPCSIFHSDVMNRVIFINVFGGTIRQRILKFDSDIRYCNLCCVLENKLPPAYHSLYLSFFFCLSHKKLCSPVYQLLL